MVLCDGRVREHPGGRLRLLRIALGRTCSALLGRLEREPDLCRLQRLQGLDRLWRDRGWLPSAREAQFFDLHAANQSQIAEFALQQLVNTQATAAGTKIPQPFVDGPRDSPAADRTPCGVKNLLALGFQHLRQSPAYPSCEPSQ